MLEQCKPSANNTVAQSIRSPGRRPADGAVAEGVWATATRGALSIYVTAVARSTRRPPPSR